jgi:arylsulfatase A-like enzyme/tetratricopeptide (TPR) repeat protein
LWPATNDKSRLAELSAVRRRACFLLSFLLLAACTRERPRRNVLLITLDTFRADRIGARTPALARLAAEGVRFDNADSPVPLTLPAHSTLLSALLPLHHGVRNNGAGAFPGDRETLATLLSRGGYRTGAFVGSFILDHRFGLARGFDRYDDDIARSAGEASGSFEAERRGGEVVDRALAWLKQPDGRPFFAWVHLYDAHAPYAPPAPYAQTYDGEIEYVDAQVARLLAAIDRANTIVVVVGDHGESLGEHGELTHGLLLYEPTLHVPLIVAAPSLAPRVMRGAVSTVDVAPTIAALLGLKFPAAVDGVDALSECCGEAAALRAALTRRTPKAIYAETEYPATLGWSPLASIRSGDRKLIAGVSSELFDLHSDPSESANRLTTDRRTFRTLAASLDALRATATASHPTAVDDETRRKLASLGYVAPAVPTAPREARDPRAMAPLFRRYEEALWAINSGRARAAIAPLEQLVRDDPSNHVFRGTLAQALRQSGERARAVALYRQAVALAPHDADAWYNLASALQESGNGNEAAIAIDEASRRDPNRPELHNLRGVALAQRGDLAGAERELRSAIATDPHDARAWNNLGNVLRDLGRADDALAAYESAIRAAPRYADALNGLGAVLAQKGRAQQALRAFDSALEIAPDFYQAQLNRAVALTLAGDQRAAAEELRRLLARLPKDLENDDTRRAAQTLLERISPEFHR